MNRIAASTVITPDGVEHHNYVVELQNGKAVETYPLSTELPMTEWICGTVKIANNKEILY